MGSEAVYEIYIDVIYGNYVVMNYLTLTLTGMLLKRSATRLRRLLAAMLGAGLGLICMLLPGLPDVLRSVFGYGICGILTVVLTYRLKAGEGLLYGVCCMYLLTFLYGGCFSFLENRFPYLREHGYTMFSVTILAYLLYVLIRKIFEKLKRRSVKQEMLYLVSFTYRGTEYTCRGLYDTGNQLYEPLRKKPVCIIEDRILMPQKEWIEAAIPYHSVGCRHGMLYGVYVKDFFMEPVRTSGQPEGTGAAGNTMDRKKKNGLPDVLLAIYPGRLSASGSYEMILHPALMEFMEQDNVIGKGE